MAKCMRCKEEKELAVCKECLIKEAKQSYIDGGKEVLNRVNEAMYDILQKLCSVEVTERKDVGK